MNCPDCDTEMLEGQISVYETLWGRLTRLGVLPIFVGESWKKLCFRPRDKTKEESYLNLPFSRSKQSGGRDALKCMKCGCVFIDKAKSRFAEL